MKKIISVSAIAAVVLLTGCWEGSSSGVSAPDFATKMAKVESTDDVVKALFVNTNDPGIWWWIGEPASKKNAKDTKVIKELSFITEDSNIKPIHYIDDLIERAKDSKCEYYKFENDYKCDEGSFKEIDVIKRVGDECVIDQKIIGDKCNIVNKYKGKIRNTQYFNGLYEVSFQVPVKEDGSMPNEEVGTWKEIMNFVMNVAEFNSNEEKYYENKWKSNLEIVDKTGYKKFNNTYVSNNIFETTVKGTFNFNGEYLFEDYYKWNGSGKMNWNKKVEGDRNYTKTLNGWYDIVYKFTEMEGGRSKNIEYVGGEFSNKIRIGVAAKNFVIKHEVNSTNFSKTTYSGKIGNVCIGGLVDFTTNAAVERNESEKDNVLPYAGQLDLKGAGNTEALVTYKYEDNNKSKSYVEINTTKGNKVYHDRNAMYNDARRYCPSESDHGLKNKILSRLMKLINQ